MIEKIRGYPGQCCDLFLRDFLFNGLHGLHNLVVKKHSVNKKAEKIDNKCLFLFKKLSN